MPYIKKEQRTMIDVLLEEVRQYLEVPGQLNYAITKLCHEYIRSRGVSYTVLNEVHGALHCADAELYRSVTAPYEDKKIAENGPVSELDR